MPIISLLYREDRLEVKHIVDCLDGNEQYKVEQFFHFHPQCSVKLRGATAVVSRKDSEIELNFDPQMKVELFKGSEEPLAGWFSKSFNQLEESTTIVCGANAAGKTKLHTKIKLISNTNLMGAN